MYSRHLPYNTGIDGHCRTSPLADQRHCDSSSRSRSQCVYITAFTPSMPSHRPLLAFQAQQLCAMFLYRARQHSLPALQTDSHITTILYSGTSTTVTLVV
eukprot:GHUV01020501.1.p2 GENE.GHUV01020501.1~~GHUV01020501.1.p2  ORF type:complete len:100 (+),score=16.36 GHUV01020501.1:1135-1434(+)